jgi:5'-nucleotidase
MFNNTYSVYNSADYLGYQERWNHENKAMNRPFSMHCRAGMILLILSLSACAGQDALSQDAGNTPQPPYRILITNDDGVESEGIRQLAIAVAEFAEVVVVAPEKNESGASQSSRLLRLRATATAVDMGDSVSAWAVNGTPADCAGFGIVMFGNEEPFDLVLSGVNYGANYGIAYLYSGTVGAAFQALADGIPAIAISQDHRREEWTTSIDFTVEVVKSVLANPMPAGELLSINVPNGDIQGVKALPGFGKTFIVELEAAEDEAGSYYKPIIVSNKEPVTGSDLQAFQHGYITVTPLRLDRNAYESLDPLRQRAFMENWSGSQSNAGK